MNHSPPTTSKILLALLLVLTSSGVLSRAAGTNAGAPANSSVVKIINPQVCVNLPRLGPAIFREQASCLSVQVPVGFEEHGKNLAASNAVVQVWLLRTDGTAIPQSEEPTVMSMSAIADYSTDYMFYLFQKVPLDELAGVALSVNGKLYGHEIEKSNGQPSSDRDDGDLFHISPANISRTPVSVQVTNVDNSEQLTVFYKTDPKAGRFLDARLEVSDAGSVISSEPVNKTRAANGFRFDLTTGYASPFKFKIIEAGHTRDAGMPGFMGYWFYLRDFATNQSTLAHDHGVLNLTNDRSVPIEMPDLNEGLFFAREASRYTVQLSFREYAEYAFWPKFKELAFWPMPKFEELHRQAWLLQANGTAIPRSKPPSLGGAGNAGWEYDCLTFSFPRRSADNIIGMVVSVNGKLYCRELKIAGIFPSAGP